MKKLITLKRWWTWHESFHSFTTQFQQLNLESMIHEIKLIYWIRSSYTNECGSTLGTQQPHCNGKQIVRQAFNYRHSSIAHQISLVDINWWENVWTIWIFLPPALFSTWWRIEMWRLKADAHQLSIECSMMKRNLLLCGQNLYNNNKGSSASFTLITHFHVHTNWSSSSKFFNSQRRRIEHRTEEI